MSTPATYAVRLADAAAPLSNADPFVTVRDAASEVELCGMSGDLVAAARALADTIRHLESVIREADAARQACADTLRDVMDETGMTSVRVDGGTWHLREASTRVVVTDETAIPPSLMCQPPPRPDREAIKRALAKGGTVPGATLTNGGPPVLAFRPTREKATT
jgi:hypothetical protein